VRDRNDHPLVSDPKRTPLTGAWRKRTFLLLAAAMALGLGAAVLTYESVRSGHTPSYQGDDDPGLIP
jgi:hypothetical protein